MHKYLQNSKSISYSLEDFFSDTINRWDISELGIAAQPLVHYLLPSLLVQMCGFIEQKYDSILWEVGYLDHSHRYDINKKHSCGSINITEYNKFFKNILNEKANLITSTANSYEGKVINIKQILENSSIKKELTYCYTYLDHVYENYPKKNDRNKIEILLNVTKKQRNEIAHFKNFYNMKPFYNLYAQDFNYIEGFAVLVALDTVITEEFIKYKEDVFHVV